ncbi:MAG: hypothetical protein WC429_03865 [Verrucomicrobiia bacterium]|jgi:hypothetical protein
MNNKNILRSLLAVAASLLVLTTNSVCGADAPPLPSQEKKLFDQAEQAWEISWSRYFRPETSLFYDYVSSKDPAKRQAHLPTVEEIKRQYPNTCGWGTGMEDSAISAGVWMATICDRYDATGDVRMRKYAGKVWAGMALLMKVSKAPGFLPRSVCIKDRQSHYIESSRDQYTHYCHGLWRFYHSPLAEEAQRAAMRRILADICTRMEEFVVPGERNYSICREDGVPGIVDKMWEVDAHEWARLPMVYLIGWDLTGNEHWRDQYRRYAWKAARESVKAPLSFRTPYAHQQAVFSLEPLVALEREDPNLRSAWLRAMEFYAGRMERFSWQCLDYKRLDPTGLDMDWRHRKTLTMKSGHVVPQWPDQVLREMKTVREPAEALLSQLLVPGRPFSADQLDRLKHQLLQTNFDGSITYSLFYPVATYWRAVKRGLITCPEAAANSMKH